MREEFRRTNLHRTLLWRSRGCFLLPWSFPGWWTRGIVGLSRFTSLGFLRNSYYFALWQNSAYYLQVTDERCEVSQSLFRWQVAFVLWVLGKNQRKKIGGFKPFHPFTPSLLPPPPPPPVWHHPTPLHLVGHFSKWQWLSIVSVFSKHQHRFKLCCAVPHEALQNRPVLGNGPNDLKAEMDLDVVPLNRTTEVRYSAQELGWIILRMFHGCGLCTPSKVGGPPPPINHTHTQFKDQPSAHVVPLNLLFPL